MTVMRLAALCVWCAALAGCAGPRDDIAAIVCAPAPVNANATMADLGLLHVAVPPGYRLETPRLSQHGSVIITSDERSMGLANGHWSAESWRDYENDFTPDADCQFDVDGIPVEVFVLDEEYATPGMIYVGAIIGFPPPGQPGSEMQALLGTEIAIGDTGHAADYRDVLRSIRRGNPRDFVHLPGVKSEYLRDE